MTYTVYLKTSAQKELDGLHSGVYLRIRRKLLGLETNPRPVGSQKLHGLAGYRVRVGDYRILYTVDDAARRIDVVAVAHPREAYR